jgi:hypothetical protein
MPAHRTRLAAAVAVLALAAPVTATSTAEAGVQESRTITIKGVKTPRDKFFAKGRVSPEYAERNAVMQRKVRGQARWRKDFRFQTNENSRYREKIRPLKRVGRVCYRVRIAASGDFRTSFSDRVCIRTFRA